MKNFFYKFKIYGFKKIIIFAFAELKNRLLMQLVYKSFSQKGEDIMIDKILGNKKMGCYIDIGANDPHRFNNTKRFYNRGWTGVNIEPDPKCYQKIVTNRKRDINLNLGIGDIEENLTFYKLIPDTLSTFSKVEFDNCIKQGYKLDEIINVDLIKLQEIFKKYFTNKTVDFLTIDTEGFDIQVLQGNDWSKYRPTLICIESVEHVCSDGNTKKSDSIEKYLNNVGYNKIFDNNLNSIYINTDDDRILL